MRVLMSWLLVVSLSLTVLVFSVADNTILHVTEFEEIQRLGIGHVNDLAFHPDNHTLAVGTYTGLYLYSIPDLVQISNFDFFHERVNNLAWSPDGKWLAFDNARQVYLWNSETDDLIPLGEIFYINKIDWSPDGTQLGAIGIPRHTSSNPTPWSKLYRWEVHNNQVHNLPTVTVQASSQRGFDKFYWTEDYMIVYSRRDQHQISAWEVDNPQQIISLSTYVSAEHQTISRDKRYIALTYHNDNEYQIHRLDTLTLQWEDIPVKDKLNYTVGVWGENTLIWRNSTGFTIIDTQNWTVEQTAELPYDIGQYIIVLSNDEKYIASISNNQLILIETSTWQLVQYEPAYRNIYTFSSGYQHFASVQRTPQQGSVIQINKSQIQGESIDIPNAPKSIWYMAFSPDNHYLAMIDNTLDGHRLVIADIATRKVLPTSWIFDRKIKITEVKWRQHDILVVLDGQIYQIPTQINGLPSPNLTHIELLNATKFLIHIYYRIFTYHDLLFFYSQSYLRFYQNDELQWQSDIYQPPSNPVSNDGNYLLTRGYKARNNYFLQIRDIQTGEVLDERPFTDPSGDTTPTVTAVAWHSNYLAIALKQYGFLSKSLIQFWPIDNEGHFLWDKSIFEIRAHNIGCCRGSSSEISYLWWVGDELYSLGNDGTVRTWGIPD